MTVSVASSEFEFPELVRQIQTEFSPKLLGQSLGPGASSVPPALWERALLGPLREFLRRPSKRVRESLVQSAFELSGGEGPAPSAARQIVEILHAGSLIIDDIQDGSSFRRGGPALHRMVGEAQAINTGSWLYFYAETLAGQFDLEPNRELQVRRAISGTILGCHMGQALDLSAEIGKIARRQIPGLVRETTRLKTGYLFSLAATLGAIAARAEADTVRTLSEFGEGLGAGLQMLDDLSGLELERCCHKGHEDLLHGRATWPWAWLAEDSDEFGFSLMQRQARAVRDRDLHPEVLARGMRRVLASRGNERVKQHFEALVGELHENFTACPARRNLESKVQELRDSYA